MDNENKMSGMTDREWNIIQNGLKKVEIIDEKLDVMNIELTKISTLLIGSNGNGLINRVEKLEEAPNIRKKDKFKMIVLSITTFVSTGGMIIALISLFM